MKKNRTKQMKLRVTEEQYEQIRDRAVGMRITMTDYLLQVLYSEDCNAPKKDKPCVPKKETVYPKENKSCVPKEIVITKQDVRTEIPEQTDQKKCLICKKPFSTDGIICAECKESNKMT